MDNVNRKMTLHFFIFCRIFHSQRQGCSLFYCCGYERCSQHHHLFYSISVVCWINAKQYVVFLFPLYNLWAPSLLVSPYTGTRCCQVQGILSNRSEPSGSFSVNSEECARHRQVLHLSAGHGGGHLQGMGGALWSFNW